MHTYFNLCLRAAQEQAAAVAASPAGEAGSSSGAFSDVGADRLRLHLMATNLCDSLCRDLSDVLTLHSRLTRPARRLGDAVGQCRWELPMVAQLLGCEAEDWEDVLMTFFPNAQTANSLDGEMPLDGMRTAASTAEAEADTCEQEYRRIPRPLRQTLEGFQQESIRFALRRHGRVVLADEMGLGKSLQALAIAAAYRGNPSGKGASSFGGVIQP